MKLYVLIKLLHKIIRQNMCWFVLWCMKCFCSSCYCWIAIRLSVVFIPRAHRLISEPSEFPLRALGMKISGARAFSFGVLGNYWLNSKCNWLYCKVILQLRFMWSVMHWLSMDSFCVYLCCCFRYKGFLIVKLFLRVAKIYYC